MIDVSRGEDSTIDRAHGKEMETCQLCYAQCFASAHQATLRLEVATAALPNHMYPLETCEHSFCAHCLRQYLKYQIVEARVCIACPQCAERMHPSDIYRLLQLNVIDADPSTSLKP